MGFTFTQLKPSASVIEGGLRLAKGQIWLGSDVLPGHGRGSKIAVAFDTANQAIKLMVSDGGYRVNQPSDDARRSLTAAARLLKNGMKIGDYIPVPGQPNVFVRATARTDE